MPGAVNGRTAGSDPQRGEPRPKPFGVHLVQRFGFREPREPVMQILGAICIKKIVDIKV